MSHSYIESHPKLLLSRGAVKGFAYWFRNLRDFHYRMFWINSFAFYPGFFFFFWRSHSFSPLLTMQQISNGKETSLHYLNLIFQGLPSLDIMGGHPFQSDRYAAKILKSGKSRAVVETLRKHNYRTMAPPNLHIVEVHLDGRRKQFSENIFCALISVLFVSLVHVGPIRMLYYTNMK